MARDLVIARIGRRSLHPTWVDPGRPREWDLLLVPYQPVAPQPDLGCTVHDVVPGPKWSGLRDVLTTWAGWRDYDQVWIPDDDIVADQDTISALFRVARGLGLQMFAPALSDASHFAHFDTMRNHSFFGRWTGFVEIMMPGLSVAALDELLPTFALTETGWGWGFDSLWPHLLGHRDIGVVDALTVLHTRPVGQMRDPDLSRRVVAESDHISARYGCRQVHTTYAAFGPDLQRLDLDPEQFFARLVRGWQHLLDDDPRLLTWLVDYQKELFRWPAYPVEGTPAEGSARLLHRL